jgi:hypothetical protein
MIGNLIASILRRYSTINNVVVARVIKSAIGGARHKISLDLSKIEPGLGGGVNASQTQHSTHHSKPNSNLQPGTGSSWRLPCGGLAGGGHDHCCWVDKERKFTTNNNKGRKTKSLRYALGSILEQNHPY